MTSTLFLDICIIYLWQTLHLGRLPTETEVDPEVQKEVQKREGEKRNPNLSIRSDVEDVRSRVASLEGSMARLEESVMSSNNRMEALLRQLLHGGSSKQSAIGLTEPPSSIQPHPSLAFEDFEEGIHAQKEPLVQPLSPIPTSNVVANVVSVEFKDGAVDATLDVDATNVMNTTDVFNDINKDVTEDVLPESEYIAVEDVEGLTEASATFALVPRSSKKSKSAADPIVVVDQSIKRKVFYSLPV